ncbi:MAG TPA: amidase [Thermoanaerobaculia bacterium]|jgi:aspartyl-tRNA(Asn)/glutamyl-tRNA(Gln) amidotransferase subunit A|nr:amidase [Thermoanaerobaculia bacterium]
MTPQEALDATVAEVAPLVRARQLSPVALAEASLERLETIGRSLNAVATLTRERALEEARVAEKEIAAGRYRGPLHGIPYGAKDLLATLGIPTGWGARPLRGQTFEREATVIRRLREAGAVLVAKLAMIELAGGLGYDTAAASSSGATSDPWDRSRWSCGSSSGSGSATAAALVGFSIGSETWGSILCPSAFNGVSGLRPTYGLVPKTGAMALSWTMDKIGPMARSAEDCGLVIDAIAGPDAGDPSSLAEKPDDAAWRDTPRRYRVGVVRPEFGKIYDREVESAFEDAVRAISGLGVAVSDVKLPAMPYDETAIIVITVEAAAAFEPLITAGRVRELVEPAAKWAGDVAKTVSGVDYVRAMQVRRLIQQAFDGIFEKYDLLVSPTMPIVAAKIADKLETSFAYPDPLGSGGNLSGLPALSVPCGFSKAGLPIAMQIVGAPLSDRKALALGRLYQENTEWHRRRPPLTAARPG